MAKTGASGRAQVRGLLLRTVHRQKRNYSDNFCIFIFPSLLVILLASLPSIIRGRAEQVKPFERDPRGATALRPFPPLACKYMRRFQSKADADRVNAECMAAPFEPGWTVPVAAKPAEWRVLGSRNASIGAVEAPGLLNDLSLFPFVYPPAVPQSGYPFADSQTAYDGIVLHEVFGNNRARFRGVANLVSTASATDEKFKTATRRLDNPSSGRSPLLDLLFNDWFKGSNIGKHFGAISFDRVERSASGANIAATVFYNESEFGGIELSSQLSATLVALESAILSAVTNGSSTARAYIRKMPRVVESGPLPFVNLGIAIFIGLTFHFLFPTFLQFMVMERQNRIRGLMAMMGLTHWRYWVGSYIGFYLMYLVSALLVIICGVASKVSFFTLNTPVSYLVLFFVWGHNLIAFAVFLAPFFKDADTALVIGWLYVILVNVVGGPFLGRRLRSQASESTWAGIMVLPSFAFLRSVYYVGAINEGGKGVVLNSEMHLGVELGMCRGGGSFCRSYIYLIAQWFILMLLGLYFDRVFPGAVGGRQHPLFFLGFKRGASAPRNSASSEGGQEQGQGTGNAEDVFAEQQKANLMARESVFNPVDGVVVSDLQKSFNTGGEIVHAVRGISFVAQKGEIMGILGHNGAGKTTMFKMLVGEIEPTGGEAHIYGYSIASDMVSVHENMGVTPQENILWPDLTIEEHLFFYGRLKGLGGSVLKSSVEQSLAAVELTFARKRLSSKCSGGMKRRLAVAISMTGNPSFIALDEPSTGLDILTREKLWVSIQNAKHDKTVLLTTHSLDEAETLCDRVAIMSRGRLMCIGRPEELKLRLGMGHHLTISLPDEKVGALHDAMLTLSSEAKIDTRMAGSVEYALPKTVPLSEIVSFIETRRSELEIQDWAISQSSLEDVFMSVTKQASEQYALENRDAEAAL